MARNTNSSSDRKRSRRQREPYEGELFYLVWSDHFGVHRRQFSSPAERSEYEQRLRAQNRERDVDDEEYIVGFYHEDKLLSESAKRQRRQQTLLDDIFASRNF